MDNWLGAPSGGSLEDLHYLPMPHAQWRIRCLVVGGFAFALVAIGVVVYFTSPAATSLLSPGPLAEPHADLDKEESCKKCHVPGGGLSDALCLVPRAPSLKKEYSRKVRTMTRGMETLWHKRALLNPFRYPAFAWMLFSHKIARWGLPWAGVAGLVGLGLLAPDSAAAAWSLAVAGVALLLALVGWAVSDRVLLPRPLAMLSYGVMGNLAALHSTLRALHGDEDPTWEPTRRDSPEARAGG